jgi:AcrR family transcriptional regulator
VHAPDAVLDAAEDLLVARGRASLTIRALAERAGASNGSIYHSFGSLETVAGSAWLRRAEQFLALQRTAVEDELIRGNARGAVQAAADSPARLADHDLRAARLLVVLNRDDVLTDAVAPPVADRLRALDVVTTCVVRLPAALLFPGIRAGRVRPQTRIRLAAAVGAVLHCGLRTSAGHYC